MHTTNQTYGQDLASNNRGATAGNKVKNVPVHFLVEIVVVVPNHENLLVEVINNKGNLDRIGRAR